MHELINAIIHRSIHHLSYMTRISYGVCLEIPTGNLNMYLNVLNVNNT